MKIEKLNWASLNRYFSRLELKWRINPINLFNKRTRRYLWLKIWFSAQFFRKSCGVNPTRPFTHLRPKFSCEKDVQEVKNRIFGSDQARNWLEYFSRPKILLFQLKSRFRPHLRRKLSIILSTLIKGGAAEIQFLHILLFLNEQPF